MVQTHLLLQVTNLAAFLAANSVAAKSTCSLFSNVDVWLNIVMWTCWNTASLPHLSLLCGGCAINSLHDTYPWHVPKLLSGRCLFRILGTCA